MNKIEKKPLFFILLLLLVTGIGFTFAYYYTENVFPSRFQAMTYNVTVEEESSGTWGSKKVSFANKEATNTPVVLRISYNEKWRKEVGGTMLSLDNNVDGTNVVTKEWTPAFTNDFVKGDDGWYYYKKLLKPEQSVQVLNSISLDEDLISTSPYYDDYKKYDYELSFNYEAIQASEKAVLDIWNKTITIEGDNVRW